MTSYIIFYHTQPAHAGIIRKDKTMTAHFLAIMKQLTARPERYLTICIHRHTIKPRIKVYDYEEMKTTSIILPFIQIILTRVYKRDIKYLSL